MGNEGYTEGPLTDDVDGSSLYLGMVGEDIEFDSASEEGEKDDA